MILSTEHDDCEHWARWCRDLHLVRGYPERWTLPLLPAIEGLIERDRLFDELEAREHKGYDEHRALLVDRLFRIWLDECRECGKCWGKRHFMILRQAYLARRELGELTIRESLRALADLKARVNRAKNPLAQQEKPYYDGGQGELSPEDD